MAFGLRWRTPNDPDIHQNCCVDKFYTISATGEHSWLEVGPFLHGLALPREGGSEQGDHRSLHRPRPGAKTPAAHGIRHSVRLYRWVYRERTLHVWASRAGASLLAPLQLPIGIAMSPLG